MWPTEARYRCLIASEGRPNSSNSNCSPGSRPIASRSLGSTSIALETVSCEPEGAACRGLKWGWGDGSAVVVSMTILGRSRVEGWVEGMVSEAVEL